MLKIRLICVGDFKEKYWKDARDEYEKRLSKFFDFSTVILKEEDKEKEGKEILSKLSGKTILLDIHGKEISSENLAEKLQNLSQITSQITFVIGGSDGVSDAVKNKIDDKISFGKITLPHQLARVVFLEQLYRAGTINAGIKYHK